MISVLLLSRCYVPQAVPATYGDEDGYSNASDGERRCDTADTATDAAARLPRRKRGRPRGLFGSYGENGNRAFARRLEGDLQAADNAEIVSAVSDRLTLASLAGSVAQAAQQSAASPWADLCPAVMLNSRDPDPVLCTVIDDFSKTKMEATHAKLIDFICDKHIGLSKKRIVLSQQSIADMCEAACVPGDIYSRRLDETAEAAVWGARLLCRGAFEAAKTRQGQGQCCIEMI